MTALINPANMKFFQEHEKEIGAALKDYEVALPKK